MDPLLTRFYVLAKVPIGADESAETDAITSQGTKYGEAPRCEVCGDYVGMKRWLPPFRVEIETWGKEFGDIVFVVGGGDLLVSDRFKQLWERHSLIGLSGFEPVEIVKVTRHRKLRDNPPTYFRVDICNTQAAIDYEASGFEFEEPPTCPACRLGNIVKRWKGIILEPGSWTGEDLFIPRGGEFMASPRFKEFFESCRITNAILVPAETYGRDFNPWERANP